MTANIYTLKTPIQHGNKTITELTVRDVIKAKDLAAMDAVEGEVKKKLAFLASITGVPLPAIMELELSDVNGLNDKVEEVAGNSPTANADAAIAA